ncbi:uncharacterized protein LOC143248584 [Tachypleus tridentatus]|uniref:uncharacterized protein LOC143248584 n=1 Tax=Tachypleus tridentatus TaxID=6853 RepID=UPI003FD14485
MVTWVTVLLSVAISAFSADDTKVTTTEFTKPNIPILVKRQNVYKTTSQSQDSLSKIIPHVTFDCHLRTEGYYGDRTFSCKVFHYCKDNGERFTFICPPESSFNQKLSTCDYQTARACAQPEKSFHLNERIYSQHNVTSQEDILLPTTKSQKETISKPPAKYDNPPVTPPLKIQDLVKTEVLPTLIDTSRYSLLFPTTHLNSVINSLKHPFLIQGSKVKGRKHQNLNFKNVQKEDIKKRLSSFQKPFLSFPATNVFSQLVYFPPLSISRVSYLKRKRWIPAVIDVNIPSTIHELQVKTTGGAQQDSVRKTRRRRQLVNSQSRNSEETDVFIRPLSSEEYPFSYQKSLLRDYRNGKENQTLQKSISKTRPFFKDTFEHRFLADFQREPRRFPARNPFQQHYSDIQNQRILPSFKQTPNQFSQSIVIGDDERDSGKSDIQDTEKASNSFRIPSDEYHSSSKQQTELTVFQNPPVSYSVKRPYSQRHISPLFEHSSKTYPAFQPSLFTSSQRPVLNLDKYTLQRPSTKTQQIFSDQHQQVSPYGFGKSDSPLQINHFQPLPPPRFVSTNSKPPFLDHSEFFQDPALVPHSRYLQDNARQRPYQNVRNGHVPQQHLHESFDLVNDRKILGQNFRDPKHSKRPPFEEAISQYGEKKIQEYDFFEPNNPKQPSLVVRRPVGAVNSKIIRQNPGFLDTKVSSKHLAGREFLGRLTPNSEIRKPAKEFDGRNAANKRHRENFLGYSKEQRTEYNIDNSQRNPPRAHFNVEPPEDVFRLDRHQRPNENFYRRNIFRRPRLHKTFSEPRLNHGGSGLRTSSRGKITKGSRRLRPEAHFNHQRYVQSHTTERDDRKKYRPDSEAYNVDQSNIEYKSHLLVEKPKELSSTASPIRDPFLPKSTYPPELPFLSQDEDENVKIPFGVRIETMDKYPENIEPLVQRPHQKQNIQTKFFPDKNSQSRGTSRQHSRNSSRYNARRKIPLKRNYGRKLRRQNIHKNQPIAQSSSEVLQKPSPRLYETQTQNQNLSHPGVQETKTFLSAVQEKNSPERKSLIFRRTHDGVAEIEALHPPSESSYRSKTKDKFNGPSQPLRQTLNSPRRPHGDPLVTELKDSDGLFIRGYDDHQEKMFPPSLTSVSRHLPLPRQKSLSQFTSAAISSTTLPRHSVPSNNFEKNKETNSSVEIEKDLGGSVRIKSPHFRSDSLRSGRRRSSFVRRFRRPRNRFRGRKKIKKTKDKTETSSFKQPKRTIQTESDNLREKHESSKESEIEILNSGSKHGKVKNSRRLNKGIQEVKPSTNRTISLPELKIENHVELTTISKQITTLIPRRVFSSRVGGSISSGLSRFKKRTHLLSFGRPRFDTEISDQPQAQELSTTEAPSITLPTPESVMLSTPGTLVIQNKH